MDILIDSQYLPNTLYFSLLAKADKIIVEQNENFVKQSFRNRTQILTPNGVDTLSIPLLGSQKKIRIDEIKIDNSQKWANRHWRAIQSAYGKAPFFIHYADFIKNEIYFEYETLFELNNSLLTLCLKFLQIDTPVLFSNEYQKVPQASIIDLRSSIHPKKAFTSPIEYVYTPYQQVFGNRFVCGLSILDLLFTEGPNSGLVISKQII